MSQIFARLSSALFQSLGFQFYGSDSMVYDLWLMTHGLWCRTLGLGCRALGLRLRGSGFGIQRFWVSDSEVLGLPRKALRGGIQKSIFKRPCQSLAINAHKMAPRTTQWFQERPWDAPTKGLAWGIKDPLTIDLPSGANATEFRVQGPGSRIAVLWLRR